MGFRITYMGESCYFCEIVTLISAFSRIRRFPGTGASQKTAEETTFGRQINAPLFPWIVEVI